MRLKQFLSGFIFAGLLATGFAAEAAPQGRLTTPSFSVSGAAAVSSLYSNYIAANPGMQAEGFAVGRVEIVSFSIDGSCPSDGCYTTVVVQTPNGGYRQVLSLKTDKIQYYAGDRPYPILHVNGLDWYYTAMNGYIADLKSAGAAFVPTGRPVGRTKDQIDSALKTSGWPQGVPELVQEITPGGNAPTTLLVIPDQTTPAGQADCAANNCHVWFLVYQSGRWVASTGTVGTGLLAQLPPDQNGVQQIGVGEIEGFNTYSWSRSDRRWEKSASTFSTVTGRQ
jgi:hypothetical protein